MKVTFSAENNSLKLCFVFQGKNGGKDGYRAGQGTDGKKFSNTINL